MPARSADPLGGSCHLPDNASLQIRAYRGPADSSYTLRQRVAGDDTTVLSAEKHEGGRSALHLTVVVRRVSADQQSLSIWVAPQH